MHLARVIDRVHATRKDPAIERVTLLVVEPIDELGRRAGQPLVAADFVGAGPGEIVFYTTAYEAVLPWRRRHPEVARALIDAGIIGIVDRIDLAVRR